MAKSRNNSSKIILIFVAVFVLAFGLGFLTNDFLNPLTQTNISESVQIIPSVLPLSTTSVSVVAVSEDGSGVVGKAYIELVNGRGRILVNTNPFIEADTQLSAETAIRYAINYTKINPSNYDIIVSFNMTSGNSSVADVVGGPSAGSALSVAAIAAFQNKTMKNDVSMTGSIEPDGNIGKVGGVPEKAAAAGSLGIKIFLVPKGQGQIVYNEKTVQREIVNGFEIEKIRYIPKNDNLNNYTMSQWNMTTIEVRTVEEALVYSIQ